MAVATDQAPDLPFEAASVLRLIRGFLECSNVYQPDALNAESAGVLLWDLSADADAAPGLLNLQLLPALSVQIDAFLAGQLPGQSAATHQQHPQQQHQQPNQQAASDHRPSDSPTINSIPAVVPPARVVEICCGILANLYSVPSLIPQLVAAEALSAAVAALMGELTDPAALAELCRLFAAALSTPQGCSVWLPVLLPADSLAWLLHIVSNTLHPLLLERSLQLLAALIAVDAESTSPDAAVVAASAAGPAGSASPRSQQEGQQQQAAPTAGAVGVVQQLLLNGLPAALEAVLAPAAAPGAQLQEKVLLQANSQAAATAAGEEAGGSSWSDEDEGDEGPAGADTAVAQQQDSPKVYQLAEVRSALLHCLSQLGQEDSSAEHFLHEFPALAQLLLQLVLACRVQDQHEVLELLLPVLVLYREGVLPLLRGTRAVGELVGDDPDKSYVLCLHCWVCIAECLSDCGPDSLDAVDAAWFLLASVAPHAQAVQECLQGSGGALWAEQQLQQLRTFLSNAAVPETSQQYARQCAAMLLTATATV